MLLPRYSRLFLLTGLLFSAEKGPPAGRASADSVEIEARVYLDKASVKAMLGQELDPSICVVEVKLAPKGEQSLRVYRDDFTLRSDKDGQKSQPFAPSQIAGDAVLVVSSSGGRGGGFMTEESGPVWGGTVGDRPRRMGGQGASIGNTEEGGAQATVHSGAKAKENPLLAALEAKTLPEKEIREPLQGLLYFPLEGKHKPKDLELLYRGPAGKLSIRFK